MILIPSKNDIVLGRDNMSYYSHHGNLQYRKLVESKRAYYSSLKRQSKEKTQYPEIIKEEIISNGGRFIIYNETKKAFDLVTDEHIHASIRTLLTRKSTTKCSDMIKSSNSRMPSNNNNTTKGNTKQKVRPHHVK